MNSNVLQFPTTWDDPQVQALQGINLAFMTVWQRQHYAFLPQLHQWLERHARFFIKSVEAFHRHAGHVSATINVNDLNEIIANAEALDDPQDIAEYVEVGQDAISSIKATLATQMKALRLVLTDIAALGVYDVSRDLSRYQAELAKLDKDQPARASESHALQVQLASLDESIKVLEAANLEALFKGSVPSSQQIRDAAAMIAAGGVTVEAVEHALKQIGELIGNVLEGMRYSRILEQRRDLQKTVNEAVAALKAMEQSQAQTQAYCDRLAEYPPLIAQREQWYAAFNQIVQQLGALERQLNGYQVNTLESLLAVQPLIGDLHAYSRKVLADFRPGQ